MNCVITNARRFAQGVARQGCHHQRDAQQNRFSLRYFAASNNARNCVLSPSSAKATTTDEIRKVSIRFKTYKKTARSLDSALVKVPTSAVRPAS